MKIVINTCYGGFSLSTEAILYMRSLGCQAAERVTLKGERYSDTDELCDYDWDSHSIDLERNDPCLVHTVEHLGKKANGDFARLKVVEIPNGVAWDIHEYDGLEHVEERHQTWC